jgi:hypothetical protein
MELTLFSGRGKLNFVELVLYHHCCPFLVIYSQKAMVTQTRTPPPPFFISPFIRRILAKDGYREAATLAIRIMAVVFRESTTILNHLQPSTTSLWSAILSRL